MIQIWQGIYWNMTESLIRTADRRCYGPTSFTEEAGKGK